MSSILRISGESLDIDALLSLYPLPVDRAWKKGEPRILKGRFHSDSGANFLASDADLDEFDRQVSEATEYLEQHAPVIAKMVEFPGGQFCSVFISSAKACPACCKRGNWSGNLSLRMQQR
jgi:hypothetical protein